MNMSTSISAPSPTLLRFLRAQSEGICFFSTNQRHAIPNRPRSTSHSNSSRCAHKSTLALSRHDTDIDFFGQSYQSHTVLNAGFASLRHVWHKSHNVSQQSLSPRRRRPESASCGISYTSTRNASQGWLRRLFWRERQQKQRPLLADDLPQGRQNSAEESSAMLNMTRSIAAKAGSELKLRCTELDENGNVVTVNGEFKKSELIAKV